MIDSQVLGHATAGLLLREVKGLSLTSAAKLILGAPTLNSASEVSDWIRELNLEIDNVNLKAKERMTRIERGLEHSIFPIPISDERYPATLRFIEDAPPVLFFRGDIRALLVQPGLAVVGTRKASSYGLEIAGRIAGFASDAGLIVVSGLALGIDAAAHKGALKAGGLTIAVLAHGLEKASPLANANLADEILECGGVWVSEHPYKTPALAPHFVQRNRIQVGLASGSVIVEGESRSGSKTQAEFCMRNKRILFAVRPTGSLIGKMVSELPMDLIQHRGAVALASRDDYPMMVDLVKSKQAWLEKQATDKWATP